MGDAEVFDFSKLLTSVCDDRELASQVVGVFLTDLPVQLADFDDAVDTNDLERATRAAHSIKGAAATVGAENLRSIAYEGEMSGRDGDREKLRALAAPIRSAFADVEKAMHEEGFEAVPFE